MYAAKGILRALGLEKDFVEVVACPTCGRCEWDCIGFAAKVNERVKNVRKKFKVAVMGCIVNGPGESEDADLGIAGGRDNAVIYKNGKIYKKLGIDEAENFFYEELEKCLN